MNSYDIVKRIMDLKKISVELKQSTEEPEKSDTNLLRGILEMGKSLSAPKKREPDDSPSTFSIVNLFMGG